MKKILKILILIVILILLFNTNAQVYALSGIIEDGKSFIEEGNKPDNTKLNNMESLQNLSGYLYNVLLALGVIIAVIVATVLGIQFMIGGAEGQAKVKEMLLPFVVGCVVVFGGFGFWKIAITVGERLEETSATSSINCEHEQGGTMNIGGQLVCRDCGREIQWYSGDILCKKCGKRICPNPECGRMLD